MACEAARRAALPPDAAPEPRAPIALHRSSPRDLRALPGIGETRALAIARERWRVRSTGEALDLEALPGIGPETVAALEAWLGISAADPATVGAPGESGGAAPPSSARPVQLMSRRGRVP
jgi:hypothetical protein